MAQITPIKGFTNTPVTKSLCVLSTLLALAVLIFQWKPYVVLAVDPFIVEYSQYWRVATFQLAVRNESDYMLVMVLLFHFKTLERFFGSKKYLSVIALFALYNSIVTFLVLCIGQLLLIGMYSVINWIVWRNALRVIYFDTIFNSVCSGPIGIVALLYMCYRHFIPTSYYFKILLRKPTANEEQDAAENDGSTDDSTSIILSDSFLIHALFAILVINNGIESIWPCIVGLIIGKLYTQDLLAGSKNWAIPTPLFRLFVNPNKFHQNWLRTIRRWNRYQTVSQTVEDSPQPEIGLSTRTQMEEEETEQAIDDINVRNPQERSATPARPLGRQFLDIFRA